MNNLFIYESPTNYIVRARRSIMAKFRAAFYYYFGAFSHSSHKPLSFGYGLRLLNSRLIEFGSNFSCGIFARLEVVSPIFEPVHLRRKPKIIIGSNVSVGDYFHCGASNNIYIGDNVLIGSNVLITDHSHGSPRHDIENQSKVPPISRPIVSKKPVIIEENVWICDGVSILPGAHIKSGSIIAANAVVRAEISSNTIVF